MTYFPDVTERLTRKLIDTTLLRYQPEVGITYGNLGKCGCTTLKSSIWKRFDEVTGQTTFPRNKKTIHQRKKDPFVLSLFDKTTYDFDQFRSSIFVTVVRNPFARVLSGYLNKVGNDDDMWVWGPIRNRFGLREGVGQDDLSFLDFLRMIETERPQHLDHHFMPMWLASAVHHVPYHRVLHLEDAPGIAEYFAEFDIAVDYLAPHSTGATERMKQYYCDDAIALVRKIYAEDFRIFGYDPDGIDDLAPTGEVHVTRENPDIRDWIAHGAGAFDPEKLTAESHHMLLFNQTPYGKAKQRKIALAYEGGMTATDWKRVKSYAHFLNAKGEEDLADELCKRLPDLMGAHRNKVSAQAIFSSV